jgi:hypothetical protein
MANGHGGRRVGSGRKPKSGATIIGIDGQRRSTSRAESPAPGLATDEKEQLLEPPKDLPKQAAAWWRKFAPHAVSERTLTPATAHGFAELCMRKSIVDALDRRIRRLGIGSVDALSYLKERRGQSGQLTASLKDFKLEAFGKPAVAEKPKGSGSQWGSFGQPSSSGTGTN